MRIFILFTIVESAAATLWLMYWYYRRSQSRAVLLRPLAISTSTNPDFKIPSAPVVVAHWSLMNESQVEGQRDDRKPMNGSVASHSDWTASADRAFARRYHQSMYKKWSQDRRGDQW
ncbi:MAG: hypothetical protein ABR555_09990 [Pyrinomonadaceae bacterium]